MSRHLAILAMTGGGKTVAARRIIRELIDLKYRWSYSTRMATIWASSRSGPSSKMTSIRIFYPMIRVRERNLGIVADLVDKMGRKLTEAQQQFYQYLVSVTDMTDGEAATDYIQRLIDHASAIATKQRRDEHIPDEISNIRGATINAARRSLEFVLSNLRQMEHNNERLRSQPRFKDYLFEEMPDPFDAPENIVRPGTVSTFYLAVPSPEPVGHRLDRAGSALRAPLDAVGAHSAVSGGHRGSAQLHPQPAGRHRGNAFADDDPQGDYRRAEIRHGPCADFPATVAARRNNSGAVQQLSRAAAR